MPGRDEGSRSAMRAIAVAAIALAGLAFSLLPVAERLDAALLDLEWQLLRRFDWKPAPEEIIIVGVDEATVRAIPEPPGLWHAALGRALIVATYDLAKEHGCKRVYWLTHTTNTPGRTLYDKVAKHIGFIQYIKDV